MQNGVHFVAPNEPIHEEDVSCNSNLLTKKEKTKFNLLICSVKKFNLITQLLIICLSSHSQYQGILYIKIEKI